MLKFARSFVPHIRVTRASNIALFSDASCNIVQRKNHQLVIVGTGWAGYKLLVEAKKLMKNYDLLDDVESVDVVVVSERNHFLYTPLLASTTVGTLEFRSIIETVRVGKHHFRNEKHFHLASVKSIDADNKKVNCISELSGREYSVPFDTLIIACGARPNTFGIPGVEKYAYFLKEIWHAREIRKKILESIELATQPGISDEEKQKLLHFVVVGGGPTGVEFCGELYDFVRTDITKIYPQTKKYLRVSLLDSGEILGAFDKKLRDIALVKLRSHENLEIIKQNCKQITADSVILTDGTELPCGLVVWTAGVGPSPLTKTLPFAKAPNGNLLTNEFCQVQGVPEIEDESCGLPLKSKIFAIGDCAQIDGYRLPATAQVAQSEAEYLCHLFDSISRRKPPKPYLFHSKGMMAYLGNYEALLQVDKPNAKWSGWSAWFAWRSTYLTKLGSWRLRLQVPIDWLKTFIVGRDVSRF